MYFCVFFSQHFFICVILLFSYIQTVAAGLGRKYQETSVPLNVELISSTDVKYNYKERRLFNRRKGASFTLRSHFAHHICYTLDGSTPGCHDKSTNDNSKVHCKVVYPPKEIAIQRRAGHTVTNVNAVVLVIMVHGAQDTKKRIHIYE